MVDVRGDVLRPPHGTTPAAVKSNENQKWDPLRAMKTFIRRKVGIHINISGFWHKEDILTYHANPTPHKYFRILTLRRHIDLSCNPPLPRPRPHRPHRPHRKRGTYPHSYLSRSTFPSNKHNYFSEIKGWVIINYNWIWKMYTHFEIWG